MATVEQIAGGYAFDTEAAIRDIAKEIVVLHNRTNQFGGPNMAARGDALATLFNQKLAKTLVESGYGSPEAVTMATDAQLLAIDGIDDKAVKAIREKLPQPLSPAQVANLPSQADNNPLVAALGKDIAVKLAEAGYTTTQAVGDATDEDLLKAGMDKGSITKIRQNFAPNANRVATFTPPVTASVTTVTTDDEPEAEVKPKKGAAAAYKPSGESK